MRQWYEFVTNLVLLGLGLFVVACLYGFCNVLNSGNIVSTLWNTLINTFAS